jgi:hypothetical protein
MADLIGSATIRVDMRTADAVRSLRRLQSQADGPLRQLQNRVRAVTRDLNRIGDHTVRVRVDVDTGATAAASAALRDLRQDAQQAGRALGTLATRAATATAALTALGAAARSLRGDMDDLDQRIRRTGDGMNNLRGRLGTVTTAASSAGSAMEGLGSAALMLAPALIPIAVQAAPIAASLGAAAVALGAFGAAAAGQASAIGEAGEAEKKYREAIDEHGRSSKQAADAERAWLRQLSEMPPQTRVAATALSSLKDQYREWSDALAVNTMPVVTRGIHMLASLFPRLTPTVKGASRELMRMQDILAGGMQAPGFDQFMRNMARFSTGVLERANDALVRFMRTANTGAAAGGASQFMEFVRANGPLVRDTLANLGQALRNILEAASNVGPGLLTVVNALAGLVAAVPPGAITAMLQLSLAIKAVRLAAAGMTAVSAAATAFAASVGQMRTAAAGATGVLPRLAAAIGAMSRATKVAVAGTGIGLLVIALSELADIGKQAPPDVDRLTSAFGRLGRSGQVVGEAAKAFGSDLSDLHEKVSALTDPSNAEKVQQWIVTLGGIGDWDSTPVKQAKEQIESIDTALANLVKEGRADLAAAALKRLTAEYGKGGRNTKDFTKNLDGYKEALADAKFEQQLIADSMGLFGEQAGRTSAKLNEQKASADGLRQAIQALNDVNRSALGGQIAFDAAIDAAAKAAKENAGALNMVGGVLDTNSPKAQAAASALNDLAAKTDEAAASARESGQSWTSVNAIYDRGRAALIKTAMQMGLTRAEAKGLAEQLLNIPDVKTRVQMEKEDAQRGLEEFNAAVKKTPGAKSVTLNTLSKGAEAILESFGLKVKRLPNGKVTVTAQNGQALSAIKNVQGALSRLPKSRRINITISHFTKRTQRIITEYQTRYLTGRSQHDIVGATGGLYTGDGFKYRGRRGYAVGGLVRGPGTGTSDSIPAPFLSNGEFVVNAKQTRQHLPLLRAINDGQLGMAGGGMMGAGASVGAGLVAGMTSALRSVEAAARDLAGAVTTGVEDELQIASPSKKMKALAKDVGKGFIQGLTGSRDKIKSVSKDLAADVRAAFSGRRETALIRMIDRNTSRLLSAASKRDALEKKIAEAEKFAKDTASRAASTGSLATIISKDAFAPKWVEKQMKTSLAVIKKFTANVQTLQKRGLNKNLLRQILEMGPDEGAQFAQALVRADTATIKRFNSLQSQISSASTKLGRFGADALYDSGKQASKGFLSGLKAQKKDIEKLMLSIAKAMQKSIKKALGIRSPSTVFAEIGRNIGDGLIVGLDAVAPKVAAVVEKVSAKAVESARKVTPKKSTAKAKPKSGFEAAVAELQRLVDTGKWKKTGSLLFEDISFQGMSKNFQQFQVKVADGFWAAVEEIKRAVKAGKMVFEDMTFKGMSANVLRFHDVIAQIWKGNPYGRNFGDWGNFGQYKQYGKYASGGLIVGPGSGTADRIPIMASNREFMMSSAAVRHYGVGTMAALNAMRIPRSVISQSVATSRSTGVASASSGDVHIHLTVQNNGAIGSQMQMQDWLAKSLDNLARTNRLPAGLRRP